ncbi:MAG: response regulator [Verrucomicrobia bacterium]|nr:MAG: response regulator [Verrucomicrobiota bacterium]
MPCNTCQQTNGTVAQSQATPGKMILVVEDDPRIAEAYAIRCESAGYQVRTAVNGVSAVLYSQEERPDLIIMDVWMPAGIGLSVAQRLRSLGLADVPIIFVTASKLPGLRQAAEKLGAAGFLEKPVDANSLLKLVGDVLAPSH